MYIDSVIRKCYLSPIGTGTGKLTPQLKTIFEDMKQKFENNQASHFFDGIRSLTVFEKRVQDTELTQTIRDLEKSLSKQELINQVLTDLEGKDTTERLKKIQCQTLLILGKQDVFYRDEMNTFRNNIPHNDYIEVDHCGHLLPLEQPEAISALLELWLKKELF